MGNLAAAIQTSPTLTIDSVEAFGREAQPLSNYVNASQQVGSEFMLKVGGKKRRVYSWVDADGTATYVIINGVRVFLSDELDSLLTYAPSEYGKLTPIAQSVTVSS